MGSMLETTQRMRGVSGRDEQRSRNYMDSRDMQHQSPKCKGCKSWRIQCAFVDLDKWFATPGAYKRDKYNYLIESFYHNLNFNFSIHRSNTIRLPQSGVLLSHLGLAFYSPLLASSWVFLDHFSPFLHIIVS